MFSSNIYQIVSFIIVLFHYSESGERTKNKIYKSITGHQSCFRLLNGTHQIGCSSQRGGNVGVVHYMEDEEDLRWLVDTGPHQPYVVMLTPHMYNGATVTELKNSGKVNGILVISYNDTDLPQDGFSPDDTCPNRRGSMYQENEEYADCGKAKWNPLGTAMMFQDLGLPIMTLSEKSEVQLIIEQCFRTFNAPVNGTAQDYPLCAAEVKDDMWAAKDTPTCIRRSNLVQNLNPERFCDPIGDKNVYVLSRALDNNGTETPEKSIILAATKMDGFSMFEGAYNDTETTVTGVVALLAAAEAWGRASPPADHSPVMFTFFQGESWDYIGSSRMVYDMKAEQFPSAQTPGAAGPQAISLSHLKAMLEVTQVGLHEGTVWAHYDPLSTGADPATMFGVTELLDALKAAAPSELTVASTTDGQPLPPASLQSFLKEANIPGVVVTDYNDQFANKFYNSRLDLPGNIDAVPAGEDPYNDITPAAQKLAQVATLLVRSLYKLSTGNDAPVEVTANETVVANLLYCFTQSAKCELFYKVVLPQDVAVLGQVQGVYKWYVSVSRIENHVTKLVHRLMSYFLGEPVNNVTSSADCNASATDTPSQQLLYNYVWMSGCLSENCTQENNMCIKTTANKTEALSPAFYIDDYDWTSGSYSSWTESQWDTMTLRIFLKPSPHRELATLLGGLALFLFFLGLVFLISRRGQLLFDC